MPLHHYKATIEWTGNTGSGTSRMNAYSRNHSITVEGKHPIEGSSDPAFSGDPSRYNPEELLLASLSSCHMLWFLSLCAGAKVIVTAYSDHATGTMTEGSDGGGHFTEVVLHPNVTVQDESMLTKLDLLHQRAHQLCFIANSVNFPVLHQPQSRAAAQ